MLPLRIRRLVALSVVTVAVLSVCAIQLRARLALPPSMADVRGLAEKAPIVFRGHVATIVPKGKMSDGEGTSGIPFQIARFQVDRVYRGTVTDEVSVLFAYTGGLMGHYCIDFQPDTYWLVFASASPDHLKLIDDCEGALAISPLLGPALPSANWLAQMETDFLAGLRDEEPDKRILSIQRLGGLKLASSREALHRVIDKSDKIEGDWAVYAALRTGDVSVLPRIRRILTEQPRSRPADEIAFELQKVSDPDAVPELLAILDSAPDEFARSRVLIALAGKLKDPRSVPSLIGALSIGDSGYHYIALEGLSNITHEKSCTLPQESHTHEDVEWQARICRKWWEQTGKSQPWKLD